MNEQKMELLKQAKEMRTECYWMLENAPQEMSNVSPIIIMLEATNRLIICLER